VSGTGVERIPSLIPLRPLLGRPVTLVRVAFAVLLVVAAVFTPGFLSGISLFSLLTTTAFIGCVATGMTFITLSGNIMSFSLSATLSATTVIFVSSLSWGLGPALLLALVFSGLVNGVQGWIIGYFRANPIIVSMATLALILGVASLLTGNRGVYPQGSELDILKGRVGPVPIPLIACLLLVALTQGVLSFTAFGRRLYMVGSNSRAARAAGVEPWRTVTIAYALAGVCTGVAAILLASRYGAGDMQQGNGYDYSAISAVLVGGNAIQGGEGSVLRTLAGALVIATVQGLLLLHGFSTQIQYLTIGLIVLVVIMLHTSGEGS